MQGCSDFLFSLSICEQQRRRPACAFAQTDQRLCFSLFGEYDINTCYQENLAEETGLSLALLVTPKTGFVTSKPVCCGYTLKKHLTDTSNEYLEQYFQR